MPKIPTASFAPNSFKRVQTSTGDVNKIPITLGTTWTGGSLTFLGETTDTYARESGSKWSWPFQIVLARQVERVKAIFIDGNQAWYSFKTYRTESGQSVSGDSLSFSPEAVNSVNQFGSSAVYAVANENHVFLTRPLITLQGLPPTSYPARYLHGVFGSHGYNISRWLYTVGDVIKNTETGESVEIARITQRSNPTGNQYIRQAAPAFYDIELKTPFTKKEDGTSGKPTGTKWEVRDSKTTEGVPSIGHKESATIDFLPTGNGNFEDSGKFKGEFTFLDGRDSQLLSRDAPELVKKIEEWEPSDFGVPSFLGVGTIYSNNFWTGSYNSVPPFAFLHSNRTLDVAADLLGIESPWGENGVNPVNAAVELYSNPIYGENFKASEWNIPICKSAAEFMQTRFVDGANVFGDGDSVRTAVLGIMRTYGMYFSRNPVTGKHSMIPSQALGARYVFGNDESRRIIRTELTNNDRIFYLDRPDADDLDYLDGIPVTGSRFTAYSNFEGVAVIQEFTVNNIEIRTMTGFANKVYAIHVDRLIQSGVPWQSWRIQTNTDYPVYNVNNITAVNEVISPVPSKQVYKILCRGTDLAAPNRKIGVSASLPVVDPNIPREYVEDDFPFCANEADLFTIAKRELARRNQQQSILKLNIPLAEAESTLPGAIRTVELPDYGLAKVPCRITHVDVKSATGSGVRDNASCQVTLVNEGNLGDVLLNKPPDRTIIRACPE